MADGDTAAAVQIDKELLKKVKIGTGVVKRLHKEVIYYEKEAKALTKKVEEMIKDQKDEYEIKKQREVAQESESMIPDTQRRLKSAIEDLKNLLGGVSNSDTDFKETNEYKAAVCLLEEVQES